MQFSLIILSLLACFCMAISLDRQNKLLIVNQENYDLVVNSSKYAVIIFYALHNDVSSKLLQNLEKIGGDIIAKGVELGKCNAIEEVNLSDRMSIINYPTLYFYKQGVSKQYQGSYESTLQILQWIQRHVGFPSSHITSPRALQALKQSKGAHVLYYDRAPFDLSKDNFARYLQTASLFLDFEGVNFFHVDVDKILSQTESLQLPFIRVIKPESKNNQVQELKLRDGNVDQDQMYQFILLHSEEDVISLNALTAFKLFMYEFPTVIIFADMNNERKMTHQFNTTVAQIGAKLRGRYRFVLSGVETEIELKIAETVGYQVKDARIVERLTSLTLFDFPLGQDLRAFKFSDFSTNQINSKDVLSFIQFYELGKLKQFIKSQPASMASLGKDYDVNILVGEVYSDFIKNEAMNTVVMFSFGACQLCFRMKEFVNKLASHFKDQQYKQFQFGAIDMELNQIPGRAPYFFPSLWIYTQGQNKEENMLEYDGDDSIEAFKQFLQRRNVALRRSFTQETTSSDL